ncbi:MAG: hypothetical protein AAGA56_03130, partial [Myxococcota bacterium]
MVVALLALALVLLGCSSDGGSGVRASATAEGEATSAMADAWAIEADFVDDLRLCEVGHRGLIFDFGGPSMVGRWGKGLRRPSGIVDVEHDGASWARIYESKVYLRFTLERPSPVFVALRTLAGDAKRINVAVDGFLLDVERLKPGEDAILVTRKTGLPLDAGEHSLQLRFRGSRRSDTEPFAEIDWLRVGIPDELEDTYGAPTIEDILLPEAQLGGVPHRGLTLRGPATLRCSFMVPPGARFRTAVGMRGSGISEATVRLLRPGREPVSLKRLEVKGGSDSAAWVDLDLPLDAYAGELVTLELGAPRAKGAGRIVFGDPGVWRPRATSPEPMKPARAVVVAVFDGVDKAGLPPWRPTEATHLPTLRRIAREWTVFDDHRAPSTLVSASM